MKQILQNFKTGQIMIEEVPVPICREGYILVKTSYSLISAGTERGTVEMGKASLVSKAKKRPDLAKQVIDNVRREGFQATINKVTSRLDTWKALGYSCSGIVIESKTPEFKVGDRVACAGQDIASHAEYVSVPRLLAVHVPENVSLEDAAFTTVGSIAMQGVRQANLRIGENVVVIGLGLLGLLTTQIVKAAGCSVAGIDITDKNFKLAKQLGTDFVLKSDNVNGQEIINFCDGISADAVIITAATKSDDPVKMALDLCRKKGRVVVVGAVGMNIPRNPFYEKEIDFSISCSYGPGRYDPKYEQQGNDYPVAYVRWTEQRNMQSFLKLLAQKKVDVERLITHKFEITEAESAYNLVTRKNKELHLGILFKYINEVPIVRVVDNKSGEVQSLDSKVKLGVIGAGNFAKAHLLPHFTNNKDVELIAVADLDGANAKAVVSKYGFQKAISDGKFLLDDEYINTVVIATRHNTHAAFVEKALMAGKNVYVEKPLALNKTELENIDNYFKSSEVSPLLQVGFNRRSAPMSIAVKNYFKERTYPLSINIRVNAGYLPPDHWLNDENIGGGRLKGEACHFIDLAQYFIDSRPLQVFAISTSNNELVSSIENFIITITYADGSVVSIQYYSSGSTHLSKELIEVYGGGKTAVINDFTSLYFYNDKKRKMRVIGGKGHKQEIDIFIKSCIGKSSPVFKFKELVWVSKVTLAAYDSILSNSVIEIDAR